MDATRAAAGRLVARGMIRVLQKGRVVDLGAVKGPIRLQLLPEGLTESKVNSKPEHPPRMKSRKGFEDQDSP